MPGTSTALIGPRQQAKPESGDCAEHRERRVVHLLRMLEMAWRIVDHVQLERPTWSRSRRRQHLGHITNSLTKPSALCVTQQVTVLLEEGTATRAVHDDRIV